MDFPAPSQFDGSGASSPPQTNKIQNENTERALEMNCEKRSFILTEILRPLVSATHEEAEHSLVTAQLFLKQLTDADTSAIQIADGNHRIIISQIRKVTNLHRNIRTYFENLEYTKNAQNSEFPVTSSETEMIDKYNADGIDIVHKLTDVSNQLEGTIRSSGVTPSSNPQEDQETDSFEEFAQNVRYQLDLEFESDTLSEYKDVENNVFAHTVTESRQNNLITEKHDAYHVESQTEFSLAQNNRVIDQFHLKFQQILEEQNKKFQKMLESATTQITALQAHTERQTQATRTALEEQIRKLEQRLNEIQNTVSSEHQCLSRHTEPPDFHKTSDSIQHLGNLAEQPSSSQKRFQLEVPRHKYSSLSPISSLESSAVTDSHMNAQTDHNWFNFKTIQSIATKFDGNPTHFDRFHNDFHSLIAENPLLTDSMRRNLLSQCLVGKAAPYMSPLTDPARAIQLTMKKLEAKFLKENIARDIRIQFESYHIGTDFTELAKDLIILENFVERLTELNVNIDSDTEVRTFIGRFPQKLRFKMLIEYKKGKFTTRSALNIAKEYLRGQELDALFVQTANRFSSTHRRKLD